MFEIHKRHTPMFVTSEVKKVADVVTKILGFDNLTIREYGVELIPMFQTVRINEVNEFIVKSKLERKELLEVLKADPALNRLRMADSRDLISALKTELSAPVVIFEKNAIEASSSDEDFTAIWLENSLGSAMNETEAFFAISPKLKVEVALNRYETVESFGSFAVGMVRF